MLRLCFSLLFYFLIFNFFIDIHCMIIVCIQKQRITSQRKRTKHHNNNVCTSHRANSLHASNHYWRMVEDFSVITGKIIVLMHNFDQKKFPLIRTRPILLFLTLPYKSGVRFAKLTSCF